MNTTSTLRIFFMCTIFSLSASAVTKAQFDSFIFLFGDDQKSAETYEYLSHKPKKAKNCARKMLKERLGSTLNQHDGDFAVQEKKLREAAKIVEEMFGH